MTKPWSVHAIGQIYTDSCYAQMPDGSYALAVAEPYWGGRLRAAWWVLTGRAYAFQWPKPGELERAIHRPFWNRTSAAMGQSQETADAK